MLMLGRCVNWLFYWAAEGWTGEAPCLVDRWRISFTCTNFQLCDLKDFVNKILSVMKIALSTLTKFSKYYSRDNIYCIFILFVHILDFLEQFLVIAVFLSVITHYLFVNFLIVSIIIGILLDFRNFSAF